MITATAIGSTTTEPKLDYTKGTIPKPYANFTIASDNRHKTTTFLRVTAWGPLADTVAEHVAEGHLIAATGRLEASEYTGTDGEKRTWWQLTADQVEFLAKPRAASSPDQGDAF